MAEEPHRLDENLLLTGGETVRDGLRQPPVPLGRHYADEPAAETVRRPARTSTA